MVALWAVKVRVKVGDGGKWTAPRVAEWGAADVEGDDTGVVVERLRMGFRAQVDVAMVCDDWRGDVEDLDKGGCWGIRYIQASLAD